MQGTRILVIDDEPLMCQLVRSIFSIAGAKVFTALSGEEGLAEFEKHHPDLVLLDVLMPGIDGWEICRQMREKSGAPIIMLTVLSRAEDIVRGLDAGADDYVTKPFDSDVLLARTRAALRRARFQAAVIENALYDDGHLSIDLGERQVSVGGEPVKLSATEFALLAYLLQNAGTVCSFAQILENVWGDEYRYSAEYVHVYIWNLRQKLESDPRKPKYLLSEHSVGYRFVSKLPNS